MNTVYYVIIGVLLTDIAIVCYAIWWLFPRKGGNISGNPFAVHDHTFNNRQH